MFFDYLNCEQILLSDYSLHDSTIENIEYNHKTFSLKIVLSTTTNNSKASETTIIEFMKLHYYSIDNTTIISKNCHNEINGWCLLDYNEISNFSKFVSTTPPIAVKFELFDLSKIIIICESINFERL